MTGADLLTTELLRTARGLLADVLDRPRELRGVVSLDVCAALNHLDLPDELPAYPDGPADRRDPDELLLAARAAVRAALPGLTEPTVCLRVAGAVRHLDDALAGLQAP